MNDVRRKMLVAFLTSLELSENPHVDCSRRISLPADWRQATPAPVAAPHSPRALRFPREAPIFSTILGRLAFTLQR